MADIDYYVFPLSVFSYLAGLGLEEIAARQGATVTYKPVQLMRMMAEVGTPTVAERHVSKQKYRLQDIARVARARGLPVNLQPRHFPTNPVPASAAIIAAQEQGDGDLGRLVHGFLRAVWAEERDIAEDEVVRDVLRAVGLRPRRSPTRASSPRSRRSSATPTRRSAASSSAPPPTWSARRSSGARTACRSSRRTSRALPADRRGLVSAGTDWAYLNRSFRYIIDSLHIGCLP